MDGQTKKQIMTAFGENLKKVRLQKNLSLRDLAAAADMEHKHIDGIEKATINPTLTTIFALAFALEVDPTALTSIGVSPS